MSTYTHFETYDFDNDPSFQAGLPSILGSATESMSDEQKSQLIDRAKWFYYSKTKEPFVYSKYLEWKAAPDASTDTIKAEESKVDTVSEAQPDISSNSTAAATSATTTATAASDAAEASSTEPTYPRSFADIVELIQTGKPIPGIRDIPNKLNEDEPTQAELAPKPKPWEQ